MLCLGLLRQAAEEGRAGAAPLDGAAQGSAEVGRPPPQVATKTHDIKRFAVFDQFPYTHHLECGVYLVKRRE
jgi:hypothetical protein